MEWLRRVQIPLSSATREGPSLRCHILCGLKHWRVSGDYRRECRSRAYENGIHLADQILGIGMAFIEHEAEVFGVVEMGGDEDVELTVAE